MICGKLPYALYFQDLFINKPVWMILPLSTGDFVKLSFHGFSHYEGEHFLKAVDNLFIMFTNVCLACARPFCHSRQACARPPFLPRWSDHRNRASGGPFFSALPEKNGEKRGALGRVDFYRITTTDTPKFVTSCKRTSASKRNYPLQARQSNTPDLPLAASEQVQTMPPAQKPRTLSRVRRNCRH